MSTSPDTRPAPLGIPAGLRAAGYDALLRARNRKLELPQAYGCALAAIEHEILAYVRREQAAELRRQATVEDEKRLDAIKAARIAESGPAGRTSFAAIQAWARVGVHAAARDRLNARADELDPPAGKEQ